MFRGVRSLLCRLLRLFACVGGEAKHIDELVLQTGNDRIFFFQLGLQLLPGRRLEAAQPVQHLVVLQLVRTFQLLHSILMLLSQVLNLEAVGLSQFRWVRLAVCCFEFAGEVLDLRSLVL